MFHKLLKLTPYFLIGFMCGCLCIAAAEPITLY